MAETGLVGVRVAVTGCWTCKDRRVRCDRSLPGCLNCSRVRTKCQGYGVRLFWPKKSDAKRAVVGKLPSKTKGWSTPSALHMIHTSFHDMEMYNYLTHPDTRKTARPAWTLPKQLLYPYSSWKPDPLDGHEPELIRHFVSIAFPSLVIFQQNAADIRDLLIQMALSNGTVSSQAVLLALLAFASQSRYGLQSRAVHLKASAIKALAKSAENKILDTATAAQHVAAGMLLCSFEIQTASETSGQWVWYIRGVKNIIKATRLGQQDNTSSVAKLIDWVNYHDVISQFSIIHWRHGLQTAIPADPPLSKVWEWGVGGEGSQSTDISLPAHRILQFLSEIFGILSQAQDRRDIPESYVQRLNSLEGGATTVEEISERYRGLSSPVNTCAGFMIRLYYMAALIYLARVKDSISGEFRNIQSLVDDAFSLARQMDSCELQFPLLILSHEARTDEQRIVILDLVRRTEENTYGRNIDCLRRSLKALWIQVDLAADEEFVPKYMDRLSAIISKTRFIPSLV